MSDILEKSAEHQELILQSLITAKKSTGGITPNGKCHYCLEEVASPKLFCDGDCATDHDRLTDKSFRRL